MFVYYWYDYFIIISILLIILLLLLLLYYLQITSLHWRILSEHGQNAGILFYFTFTPGSIDPRGYKLKT